MYFLGSVLAFGSFFLMVFVIGPFFLKVINPKTEWGMVLIYGILIVCWIIFTIIIEQTLGIQFPTY